MAELLEIKYLFNLVKKYGENFLANYSNYQHDKDTVNYNVNFGYTEYCARFLSFSAKRKVEISLTDAIKENNILISIRVKTFEDDNQRFDSFSFSEYLRAKMKSSNNVGLLEIRDNITENNIKCFFLHLQNSIDLDLVEIIKGEKWINIPFDWTRINK